MNDGLLCSAVALGMRLVRSRTDATQACTWMVN